MSKINVKLAGAVKHFIMFMKLYPKLEKYMDKISFDVYDGPNLCKWNGGRINRDITLTSQMVDWYNKKDIGVFLTFSNYNIDLNHQIGLDLLKMLKNNPRNGIVLVNEKLRLYIKDNYPNYKLIYSISGHKNNICINNDLISYYKDLETKYDVIVPRFEMGLNPLFYTEIDTSKYELITNDTCIHGCQVFEEHFHEVARINREYNNPWEEIEYNTCFKAEECWIKNFNPSIGSDEDRKKYGETLGMDFTMEMYSKALECGYRRFKIMGRELETKKLEGSIIDHIELLYQAINKE